MNDVLETMWTEVVVACLNEVAHNSPEGTEGTKKNVRANSWSPGRESKTEPPEYEAGMPVNQTRSWNILKEILFVVPRMCSFYIEK